jgi:flagellar hook-basal body complex protein FliE
MDAKTISFNPPPPNLDNTRDDISRMLKTIREVGQQNQIAGFEASAPATASFDELMQQAQSAVNYINQAESISKVTKETYLTGDPKVSLTDVVISSEKSSIAFEALLRVRNKLLEAYQQIMQMPV